MSKERASFLSQNKIGNYEIKIMNSDNSTIWIHELAFLQAYLYELFTSEQTCHKNFDHSDWYLYEKYSKEEIKEIKQYFNRNNITCDCDIIFKLDSRDKFKTLKSFH